MIDALRQSTADERAECRVCAKTSRMDPYDLHESMFGTKEKFRYLLCPICGSMQIETIPEDMGRYYPPDYYSIGGSKGSALVHWVRSQGLLHSAGHFSLLGLLLRLFRRLPSDSIWLQACRPELDCRILDVGCGRGDRLRELSLAGFTQLSGVDPYLDSDFEAAPGVWVKRGNLDSIEGQFDLIMLHHSLEHVKDPRETMTQVGKRLAAKGKALVRVPVMGKFAWRTYGADWVQLDPPRHLHQITEHGISALAECAGLEVTSVIFDSFALQFSGSEKIRHTRVAGAPAPSPHWIQRRRFNQRAAKLNQASDGDQACFILSRPKN
jgi:SAM-dependent methyltransferase